MDIVEKMRSLESDHDPDGWPAVTMGQVSALCDEIERLRAQLKAVQQSPALPDGYLLVRSDVIDFLNGSGELIGCGFGDKPDGERGNYWWRRFLPDTNNMDSAPKQSPAVAVPDNFASLLAAIKQYSNGEVIKVPDSIKTEEEFFSWLKTCGAPSPRITEPDDRLAFLVVKALHNDGGPHESLLESARRIVRVIIESLPGRITEQDAREILNAYWASNADDDDWVTTAEGRALLDKLNKAKQGRN